MAQVCASVAVAGGCVSGSESGGSATSELPMHRARGSSGGAATGEAGRTGNGQVNEGGAAGQPAFGGTTSRGGGGAAGAGSVAGNAPTLPFDPPAIPFGNLELHPQKLGFYMVPDLDPAYRSGGAPPVGATGKWCAWTKTQASLRRLSQLLPEAWIRWDNETGHNTSTTENVNTFVTCAENAGVGMIVSADAADGYDNYWANQYVTGTAAPNRSLSEIADSPYLVFAHTLMVQHANVKLIETMNEPDGPWFVTDSDNSGSFDYYLSKLISAMGTDQGKIIGPSAAIKQSIIWENYAARVELPYFSYHTYTGWRSLEDVPGKKVHVTEYGGFDLDPGAVLDDLWHAEQNGKLSGTIERLYYHQITDDGTNRGAFNHQASEGDHFAFRDWFRALILYHALGSITTRGYSQADTPDFIATDNGEGAFGALLWNASGSAKSSGFRTIPNVSLTTASQLYVVRVLPGDANTAQCQPLASQNWVHLTSNAHAARLDIVDVPPHAVVFVSTSPCNELAN